MVLSYYIVKPIYCAAWHVVRLFRKQFLAVLYCDDAFDLTLFKNVGKHLSTITCVARDRKVAAAIRAAGSECRVMPVFPDAVIMFRNMAWKFPCRSIVKFGFEHGAYNFKRFSKPAYYNLFDVFFMTSTHDVARVKKIGVTTAVAVGFPKIDGVFDGSISVDEITRLSTRLDLDTTKKTLLFSATWDGSGMSAIHLWYDRVASLCMKYNVMTTVHPWTSDRYKAALRAVPELHFIEEHELVHYIMLADVCVGDTNSLIAEFCLLDKPIITFRLPQTPRTMPDIVELIDKISLRVDTYEEIEGAIARLLGDASGYIAEQKRAVELFFDKPDGNAGKRAASMIAARVPQLAKKTSDA